MSQYSVSYTLSRRWPQVVPTASGRRRVICNKQKSQAQVRENFRKLICPNNNTRTYNENTRSDIQALFLDAVEHLILQGTNLIQDVNNLD